MKRPLLAVLASLVLAGLVPGSTLAISPTNNLDQANDPSGSSWGGGQTMAQTFTAGKTGMLSKVGLSLATASSETLDVSIEAVNGSSLPDGTNISTSSSVLVSGSSFNNNAWYYFSFPTPVSVVAGTQYAIVLTTLNTVWYAVQGNPYSGGVGLSSGGGDSGPWGEVDPVHHDDWTFRTYVDTASTQLQWNKSQITAGVTGGTPLTLTATMTYANGAEADHYGALLGLIPSWFTPTGLTCSDTAGKIVPADCTLANFGTGFGSLIPASGTGDVMTFVVTGTANPASTDVGTAGLAGGNACINYPTPQAPQVQPNAITPECGDGTATVQVVAPATTPPPATPSPTVSVQAATAPPTSTGGSPASDSTRSPMWLLPVGLLGLLVSLLAIAFRRRRIA